MGWAVNNFSKEWVAGCWEVGTFRSLLVPRFGVVAKKKCVIRKKSFDESARVAKVTTFFRKRLRSRTKKETKKF